LRSFSSAASASRKRPGSAANRRFASVLKRDNDPRLTSNSAALAGPSCGAGDGSISGQLPIGELAPDDALEGGSEAVAVRTLALVEAESLLINVAAKVERLDADIGALQGALLEQRSKRLD
jgi:hypothetical protein